jgi:hypothetical protein
MKNTAGAIRGREKMRKTSAGTTILLTGFITASAWLVPLAAQAADPAFCAGYTDAALNQVRIAMSSPNCAAGARGARWAPERRVHFDWCLGQPPAAAAAERNARTEFLRGCRG